MGKAKETKFIPFQHNQLEIKNVLIEYARELSLKTEFESKLASAFIYISFSEYLCEHLTRTLYHILKQGTFDMYAGILYLNPNETKKISTLGNKITTLENLEFPAKQEILKLLKTLNASRNVIFHNFAKVGEGDLNLEDIEKHIETIKENAEELFKSVNTVYAGLQKILIPTPIENTENGTNTQANEIQHDK